MQLISLKRERVEQRKIKQHQNSSVPSKSVGPIGYRRRDYHEHPYEYTWHMLQRRLTHFLFFFSLTCRLRVNQFCFFTTLLLLCTSRYLLFIVFSSGTKRKKEMRTMTFSFSPRFHQFSHSLISLLEYADSLSIARAVVRSLSFVFHR